MAESGGKRIDTSPLSGYKMGGTKRRAARSGARDANDKEAQ